MLNNNFVYCYIKLFHHEDDKGGYEVVNKFIENDPNLIVMKENGQEYIGFMSFDHENEDNELVCKVYPFIFKYDEQRHKFIDAISGESFSFRTFSDNPSKRIFCEDKGTFGDYIEPSLTISSDIQKALIDDMRNNTEMGNYRRILLRLINKINEGYTEFYRNQRSQQRLRERTENKGTRNYRSRNGLN